jgi:cytochrome c-type biogenesis protein CcsB
MASHSLFLFVLCGAAYLVASVFLVANLFVHSARMAAWVTFVVVAGLLLHTAGFILRTLELGHPPLATSVESLAFFSWAVVLVYLAVQGRGAARAAGPGGMKSLGVVALPLALVGLIVGELLPGLPRGGQWPASWRGSWFPLHMIFSFLGYAAFTLAFSCALTYLVNDRLLKRKHLAGIWRELPPLAMADDLCYRLVAVGFPLLTLGIVLGSIWAELTRGDFGIWEPKGVWSLVTWAIFAAYLHARRLSGWRGRGVNVLIVVGFVSVLLTYFVAQHLGPGQHKF